MNILKNKGFAGEFRRAILPNKRQMKRPNKTAKALCFGHSRVFFAIVQVASASVDIRERGTQSCSVPRSPGSQCMEEYTQVNIYGRTFQFQGYQFKNWHFCSQLDRGLVPYGQRYESRPLAWWRVRWFPHLSVSYLVEYGCLLSWNKITLHRGETKSSRKLPEDWAIKTKRAKSY